MATYPVIFFLVSTPLFFLVHFPSAVDAASSLSRTPSPSPSPSPSSSSLVGGVCEQTENYTFCIQALGSDPRTSAAKNMMDLAVISLQLGISNSSTTRNYIAGKYRSDPSLSADSGYKSALKECLQSYDGAVSSFKSALMELEEDPLTANYDAKVAGDGAVSCSDSIHHAGIKDSNISDGNRFLSYFSNIAFMITYDME